MRCCSRNDKEQTIKRSRTSFILKFRKCVHIRDSYLGTSCSSVRCGNVWTEADGSGWTGPGKGLDHVFILQKWERVRSKSYSEPRNALLFTFSTFSFISGISDLTYCSSLTCSSHSHLTFTLISLSSHSHLSITSLYISLYLSLSPHSNLTVHLTFTLISLPSQSQLSLTSLSPHCSSHCTSHSHLTLINPN